jgi:membrane-associated phospholipid phosphatase
MWYYQPMQGRTHTTIAWAVIFVLLVIDLIWFPLSRLTFAPSSTLRLEWNALAVAVLAYVPVGIRYWLRADSSPASRFTAAAADGMSLLVYAGAFVIVMGILGTTFSYLSVSLALPLRDAELAAIDRALGFDWPEFLTMTNAHPVVAQMLRAAYRSSGPQLVLLLIFLSATRRRNRLVEFLAIFAMSLLMTMVGMTLVPAEGAYAFFAPMPAQFSNFGLDSGMWHHATFVALRTQAAPVLDFAAPQGLVTFPSFHTILAIITAYAVRDVRYLAVPTAALNLLVIVSTLPEGGHYLVDLFAGGLIAVFAIFVVRRLTSTVSRESLILAKL